MKLLALLVSLIFAVVTAGSSPDVSSRTTTVFIQAVTAHSSSITPLAEIRYNSSSLGAEFISFDAPELSSEAELVRIGSYNTTTKAWTSSTSVTATDSFNKGYTPTFILSLDANGDILGVTCRSGKIDAGQTRDFGPKVKVIKMAKGKKPELNRPIITSKDGATEGEVPEKTMFQKCVLSKRCNTDLLISILQILVGCSCCDVVNVSFRRWRQIVHSNEKLRTASNTHLPCYTLNHCWRG
jgi:hypothetical protein